MPKYRKKPVVIEAIQYTDDSPDTIHKIKQFAGDKISIDEHSIPVLVNIHTLLGTQTVHLGEFITKNKNGNVSVMNEEYFNKEYEKVE